jgi:hypothetical protein
MGGKRTKKSRSKRKSTESAGVQKARDSFERGLMIRGEAAPCDKEGKLPPGATHEIVKGELVRRRFSAF